MVGLVSAHVGCPAYDLANVLATYIFTYHLHMLTPENNDQHRQVSYKMLTAAKDTGWYQSVSSSASACIDT